MYKKYNSNISRNFINKINNHTISPQTTRDHFFLRKKSPNIEDLKKSNINLINIKNNINNNNQDLVEKNYFSSRNINNNNNGPIKLLSMNEDTLKNVFSTSSINSNSSLNQNSISNNKANSMEFLTIINNKDNNNLNIYTSPDRKRLRNKRAQTFDLSFSKYFNSIKKRSNDFSYIQSDYKPIFKRRKMKIKKKKN